MQYKICNVISFTIINWVIRSRVYSCARQKMITHYLTLAPQELALCSPSTFATKWPSNDSQCIYSRPKRSTVEGMGFEFTWEFLLWLRGRLFIVSHHVDLWTRVKGTAPQAVTTSIWSGHRAKQN